MKWIERAPEFHRNLTWFIENRQDLVQECCYLVEQGDQRVFLCSVVNERQMRGMLARIVNPDEFLSDYGLR